MGKVAGGFLAANVVAGAGQKLIGFLGDSIKAASDLGESVNAVGVIFGGSSGKILDFGKTAAKEAGLSQRAFQELATPLGAMLKNAGFGMDDVAGKTIDLTKRAGDMASVFNTDVDDALAAIQAGLRGELDPLERYGVKLSAASVEQKALAMTGKDSASALTEQEKAAARVALIFEQTNDVAGDFAKTSDALANKTRISEARMEDLQATIGQKLLPVQLKITEAKLALVNAIVTHVIPALEELYARHWPAIQKAIEDVKPVVEDLMPVFQGMADFVIAQVEGMIRMIEGIVKIVTGVVDLVDAVIHGRWADAWAALQQIVSGAVDVLIGNLQRILGNLPEIFFNAGRDAVEGMARGIESAAGSVLQKAKDLARKVEEAVKNPLGIFSPSTVMAEAGRNFVRGFEQGITRETPVAVGAAGAMAGAAAFTVNMFNPVVNAQDARQAELSGGLAGWGIVAAMRSRGVA